MCGNKSVAPKRKVCLVIIDGWGHTEHHDEILSGEIVKNTEKHPEMMTNAIRSANTPYFDELIRKYGYLTLCASSESVGLPPNTIGNSQVGHLTIGAGRRVKQPLLRINDLIETRQMTALVEKQGLLSHSKKHIHLIGLVSDGGIHSHIDHLCALLKIFYQCQKYDKISIHFIADGRDTHPTSCMQYFDELSKMIKDIDDSSQKIKIGSIAGRWYTMDRDNNLERIEQAFKMMTERNTQETRSSCDEIRNHVTQCYEKNKSDEMIVPLLLENESVIEKDDTLFFFNFRTDRMKQITRKFLDGGYENCYSMADYGLNRSEIKIILENEIVQNTLAETISNQGFAQSHIAETEKYAHITYFLNGGRDMKFDGETRFLINSQKTISFKDTPEMMALEITSQAKQEIEKKVPFIVLNFANPDMVGHTGDFNATKEAVETVDTCLGDLSRKCEAQEYVLLITADHGNAEIMKDSKGPVTKHTSSRVPFIVCGSDVKLKYEMILANKQLKSDNIHNLTLADVAPSVLEILDIAKPAEMTGSSLIEIRED